tara:strand:- start:803 stop:955 length:153 start_codon:yes stop_codon:yes gene_type:complete
MIKRMDRGFSMVVYSGNAAIFVIWAKIKKNIRYTFMIDVYYMYRGEYSEF